MASENETVAMVLLNFEYLITLGNIGPTVATDIKRRLEDAHQREVAELKRQRKEALAIASDIDKCASIERHTDAMLKKNEVIVGLRKEVAELRECLKEAIREKCPFTRMSCKHGEPCDYECGTEKRRKALQDEGGAK